ncbi:MAG: TonB-dependent receptor [Rhodothermales bacterium]
MTATHKLILAVLFLFLPTGQAFSQEEGHIQGRIVDEATKHPMADAHVTVLGTSYGAVTDAEGIYRVTNLAEGVYKLKVNYLGYADFVETNVVVVRGKTTYINEIQLASSPLLTDSLTITPGLTTTSVSQHSFQREEIRRSPGTAGDVLRAMGSLPGVSTSEGEFSAMSVRGGGAYDNLILIDNIPFDKINHFEGGSNEQETQGGRFSVFTAGLVERATFYGGGFGAEYGRKGASVLDLTIKEGNMESRRLSGSYGLLGPELNYDGPTYLLDNTSLVVNYRAFDMRRALEISDEQAFGDPTMSDVIAKTTTYLNPANKISLLGVYSTDRLVRAPRHLIEADDLVENDIWDIDETRWLLGANWRLLTSEKSVLHTTVFYRGNDRDRSIGYAWANGSGGQLPPSISELGFRDDVGVQDQHEVEVGWKSDFYYDVGTAGTFNAGVDMYRIDLDYAFAQNGTDTLYQFTSNALPPDSDQKYLVVRPEDVNYRFDDAAINFAAYTSYEFGIGKFMLTPGVRYSYSGFSTKSTVAPRLQVRYALAPQTMLSFATGVYYQKPLNPYVASAPANRSLRDEKSTHFIAGVTHQLRNDLKFTLEGYYKSLDDVITPTATAGHVLTNDGDGWSSGFDAMLLKRFTGPYYGQVSYSFAVSKRNDHDGLGEYNAAYNQPHNFAVIVGYEISKNWFVTGRWKYAVGRPKDRFIVHENVLKNNETMRFSKEVTARNADRLSDFHLLSVRVDYRKQLGRFGLITFLELDNVYNRFNTYEDRFSELTGEEKGLGFGFLPNGGFTLEF